VDGRNDRRTVEEAVEAALDQLGVAEIDAEIVVVEGAEIGHVRPPTKWWRIRARVRPISPGQETVTSAEAASGSGEHGSRRQATRSETPHASRPRKPRLRKVAAKPPRPLFPEQPAASPPRSRTRSERFAKRRPRAVHEAAEATDASPTSAALRQQGVGTSRSRGPGAAASFGQLDGSRRIFEWSGRGPYRLRRRR